MADVDPKPQRVTVTGIDMPLSAMFIFVMKWTIAAIPVILIGLFIIVVVVGISAGFLYELAATLLRDALLGGLQ